MQQEQGCVLGVTGFAVKNSMRVDGGSAATDHGLISLCRLDFHYLTIWRGGEVTNNASIHTRTSLHATRAQLLDISNIQEKPSLRGDLSFP
jgi:hypothetical protein